MTTKKQFIRDYVKAIRDGNAAVFAGAGLSRPSGFRGMEGIITSSC